MKRLNKMRGLNKPRIGATKQKILLLLFGGVALGLSHSPRSYFKIINGMVKEWREINRMSLRRAIASLYQSKLVATVPAKNGGLTLVLSKRGKKIALTYSLEKIHLAVPKNWDKKWRIVMFDVPERLKKVREALRYHLNDMGFVKLQKSVFIHPSECHNEIEYLIEFYNVRQCVRFIVAESVDNELHIKQKFGMNR